MNSRQNIPTSVFDLFHKVQADLGGNFKRQTKLNPRIYSAASHTVDRINDKNHITRIKLVSPGFILVHRHHKIEEHHTILELSDGAYGHLFHQNHHRLNIEGLKKQTLVFESGQSHGLSILSGFAIVSVEIFGEFCTEDVFVH